MTTPQLTITGKTSGFLLIIVFALAGLYIYFVNTMIVEIVGSKQNLRQLSTLSLEYQQLEESYFDVTNKFNLEYAQSLGFVAQRQNNVVVRPALMARLGTQ